MKYDNYIFDLYGTLADIKTDEYDMDFWKEMAGLYSAYGAVYKPKKLRKVFFEMDREERALLKERIGCEYPEIKLEKVFLRLLKEYPQIAASDKDEKKAEKAGVAVKNSGAKVRLPENEAVWAEFIANAFRVLSREYLRLYPGTLETLDKLRAAGKKVYMLSNAQAIFTRPEIKLLELDEHMDKIYISSDYGVMKPDPMFIKALIETEGLDIRKSVMIGNEVRSDMKVAYSVGMDSILLNTGRLSKKEIKKEKEEHGVDAKFKVIESITELVS